MSLSALALHADSSARKPSWWLNHPLTVYRGTPAARAASVMLTPISSYLRAVCCCELSRRESSGGVPLFYRLDRVEWLPTGVRHET